MGLPEKLPEAGSIALEQLSKEHLILSHRYRAYMLEGFERAGLSVVFIMNVRTRVPR